MKIRLLLHVLLTPVFLWMFTTSMVTGFVLVDALPDKWWSRAVIVVFTAVVSFVMAQLGTMQANHEDYEDLKQELGG